MLICFVLIGLANLNQARSHYIHSVGKEWLGNVKVRFELVNLASFMLDQVEFTLLKSN